jgi:hypothetical protein
MRVAALALFALVFTQLGHAQQLGRPPLVPAQREATPLFPTVPLDQAIRRPAVSAESAIYSWPAPESRLTWNRATAPSAASPQNIPSQRSGPVCLKTVPVDASIDPGIIRPTPTTGLAMRTIEAPPCIR